MPFCIEPLEEEDIDTILDIYWRACRSAKVDHPLPLIPPCGLQPDARAFLREEFEPENGKWAQRYSVARDEETGEIAAVCGRKMNCRPLSRHRGLLDYWQNEVLPIRHDLHEEFSVRDMDTTMDHAFTKAAVLAELEEAAAEKRYSTLDLLATDPKHQRRGAASALLEELIGRLERKGLPCYVIASTMGKSLYGKCGFELRRQLNFDAREWYDGNRRCTHWVMVRQPQRGDGRITNAKSSLMPPTQGDSIDRRLPNRQSRST